MFVGPQGKKQLSGLNLSTAAAAPCNTNSSAGRSLLLHMASTTFLLLLHLLLLHIQSSPAATPPAAAPRLPTSINLLLLRCCKSNASFSAAIQTHPVSDTTDTKAFLVAAMNHNGQPLLDPIMLRLLLVLLLVVVMVVIVGRPAAICHCPYCLRVL